MNDELFSDLIESVQELNDMQVKGESEERQVADHVSSLVEDGKSQNQAFAIALQKAGKIRKNKGRQKAKQKGKQHRG